LIPPFPFCATRRFGVLVAILSITGCQARGPLERAGVAVVVPESWSPVEASTWMVPGTPLAAWRGPEGASFVIYRTLPVPGATASLLMESLANRLLNLPELEVKVRRTESIAGQPAAWVEVVAPGDGASLAPSGGGIPLARNGSPLIRTRQLTVGFPRLSDTLYLSWHGPESAWETLEPKIAEILAGLRLTAQGPGTLSASYDSPELR
jgi:hypothetical protein